MSENTLESIEETLKSLDQAYEEGYAGKDRSSVSPDGLVKLIGQVKDATASLEKLGALTASDSAATLLAGLTQRAQMYQRELDMVKIARELGPGFERFSIEGAAANFVFDRYNRHFAGQSRETRDLGLLRELTEELKQIKKRMNAIGGKKLPEALGRDLELVQSNIERYQTEERELLKAQATGTAEDQANRYAFLANQQFAVYQTFFAGQSRIARRPQLLVRVIDNLKRYRTGMFELKSKGLSQTSNDNNIGIVDGRVKAYENELAEIRKVRSSVGLTEIMGNLGTAANEQFEAYRKNFAGKNRTTVSLEDLGLMLDRLDEARRQMEELGRVEKNEMNVKNQAVVREYQTNWVREYQQVKAAQAASSGPTARGTA